VSSSAIRSLPADWPHYVAAKAAAEGLVAWAAATHPHIRFIIVRPPRLQTDQMNTPAGRKGALRAEDAAASIVQHICRPRQDSSFEILDAF
jgi:NAD(P)-dependent dehydrogenase (short-subunit alcohol dehydrogenase family)